MLTSGVPVAPTRRTRCLVAAILTSHAALLAWSATRQSPTFDEVAHLPAGLSHLRFGRFDLYCVNPPLVRTVAALPLLAAEPATDWKSYHGGWRPEWCVGLDFLDANGERSLWLFTLARWACIPFSLLGAYVCWRWARELYGDGPGLVALTLWSFCPNILGHGQLVTPDVGAAAFGVLAGYSFWRWLRRPVLVSAMAAGVCLGLALLAKTTWVVLFLLWPCLWAIDRLLVRAKGEARSAGHSAHQLVLLLVAGLGVLHAGYGFEGTGRPLGEFQFKSLTLSGKQSGHDPDATHTSNRFRGTWMEGLRSPLPANFLRGIDLQKYDFELNTYSYLRGEWRRGGWWYYYLYAMAVKIPIGTWLLLGSAGLLACTRCYAFDRRGEMAVLVPVAVILCLVSSQTGMNHHFRYVLPALPFLFVCGSKAACLLWSKSTLARLYVAIAIGWSVVSSLSVYPHSLSYFNELAGGPLGGPNHLLGSNVDWGQDLLYLKKWAEDNPTARPLRLAYCNIAAPHVLGFTEAESAAPTRPGPEGEAFGGPTTARELTPGWYAISVNYLRDHTRLYACFLDLPPVGRAGYSIYIYRITEADCRTRATRP